MFHFQINGMPRIELDLLVPYLVAVKGSLPLHVAHAAEESAECFVTHLHVGCVLNVAVVAVGVVDMSVDKDDIRVAPLQYLDDLGVVVESQLVGL